MRNRKYNEKAGFTLLELIITLAIAGILIAILIASVVRIAKQAYLSRANDSAEVVYMAMQSAVTDLKTQGRFDEVFGDAFLGEPFNPGAADNPDARFYAVPGAVLDGDAALNLPGATDALGRPLPAEEIQRLKADKDLIYLVLNRDDETGGNHPDSELLKELLSPYIGDKSIFNYSILVEVNRSNKTVRAAFYSEKTPELKYTLAMPEETLKKERTDVYFRNRSLLDDKDQGYFGTTAADKQDAVQKLENAFVKVYNDDMLVVEWGEFVPADAADWDAKKRILPGMTYDLYLVNAVDTSKLYYKIEGITPYKDHAGYITHVSGGTNTIPSMNGDFSGNALYGKTRMPVYDLFSWDDMPHGMDSSLTVSSFDTWDYPGGMPRKVTGAHRLSYLPGEDFLDGSGTPGTFRLVLDSITEDGYDELSVSTAYPGLPWDENFKVIVEGRYHGAGFTGSMNLSPEVENAYSDSKGLYSQGEVVTVSGRGSNSFAEFVNDIRRRLAGTARQDFWWHEISTARHLNNIRYIIRDNGQDTEEQKGKNQNFLVTQDIDWSLQKIGRITNTDNRVVHRLTIPNAVGTNLQSTMADTLKIFVPLSTGESAAADGSSGFAGVFRSEQQTNTDGRRIPNGQTVQAGTENLPLYEPYSISNLKLAKNVPAGAGNYDFAKVTPDLSADDIGLFERVSVYGELSHLTLSGITGVGDQSVGGFAGAFFGSGEKLTVMSDETARWTSMAVKQSDGRWTESQQSRMQPWNYYSTAIWKGNRIAGKSKVGGLFGSVAKGAVAGSGGSLSDLANGTIYSNQYKTGAERLNGITMEAAGDYAGGIAGTVTGDYTIKKVVNTGNISGAAYVGGIAGQIEGSVYLDGAQTDDDKQEYLVRRYRDAVSYDTAGYQNYGAVTANGAESDSGSFAGGITGNAIDQNFGQWGSGDKIPVLANLKNAGYILAEKDYAGGIVGSAGTTGIYNVQNAADVHAKNSCAGGIAGAVTGEAAIEGVQNLAAENHGGIYLDENGAVIYHSYLDTAIPAGISSVSYAGGIAGVMNDKAQMNALRYQGTALDVSDVFSPVTDSSAGLPTPLLINRSMVQGLVRTFTSKGVDEYIPLINQAQVTGVGGYPGMEIPGTSYCVGGIAGAITGESTINAHSENPYISWPVKIPVRNEGNITLPHGNYAGGIAGAAVGATGIWNGENGQKQPDNPQDGIVIQAFGYAGGIVGAVSSEQELKLGNGSGADTRKQVLLCNSEQLGWEAGSSAGAITAKAYDTNRAKLVLAEKLCAGGIAGYINTEKAVLNVFNGGSVYAGTEAGGLFGAISGKTSTEYETKTLAARMLRGPDSPYATNSGDITARSMAGGIAGAVLSSEVQLLDLFNSGAIKTEIMGTETHAGSFAGGIVGYVMTENPGTAGNDGMIRHSRTVISDIVLSSDGRSQKPVYTNTGTVYAAGSYAGGIIGRGSVSLVDVFNAADITAEDSYAGGIAGELSYADDSGAQLTLTTTTTPAGAAENVMEQMLSYATSGYDPEFLLFQNCGNISTKTGAYAGGIAGGAHQGTKTWMDKLLVSDMYNAGHVAAGLVTDWDIISDTVQFEQESTSIPTYGPDSRSAGGIIGHAQGVTVSYDKKWMKEVISSQDGSLSKDKFLPNMGNILAKDEAGGLIGSAAGAANDVEDVLIRNGMNRGVVRSEEESAGGLLGEGIWTTIRTDREVAEEMLSAGQDEGRESYSNLATIIAGTNQAGGIAGKIQNVQITDVFNRGRIHAGMDHAGGIVGYAKNAEDMLMMEISHSGEISALMFSNPEDVYIFTNTASVSAGRNNAGGIAGKAEGKVGTLGGFSADLAEEKQVGKVAFLDVYSGDSRTRGASEHIVIEAENNAGGMVGRLVDAVIRNEHTVEIALSAGIYTNNAKVSARSSNAGGIVGNADKRSEDVREYSTDPQRMKVYVDSNHFQVSDVYNIGTVTAKTGYNAGGIFGIAAAGSYQNTPELVTEAAKSSMLTNKGAITAYNNAGGVFGAVTAKFDTNEVHAADNRHDRSRVGGVITPKYATVADVLDVFNGGNIAAGRYNAGGIAGAAVHLDLRYSKETLTDTIRVDDAQYMETFLAANTGAVRTGASNAGGIIGYGYQCILQDVFNTGTSASLKEALNDKEYRIVADGANAGGIIGQANGLKLFYSDVITGHIINDRSYVYSNVANIKAGGSGAGGIAGYASNSIQISDGYNMGAVNAGSNHAGGLIGHLEQSMTKDRDGQDAAIVSEDPDDPLAPISLDKNVTIIRSSSETLEEDGKRLYRGEDYITYDRSVSYITYTTIVTGMEAEYQTKKPDSFGNTVYTNRYTSLAKPAVTRDHEYGYHVVAGGSNAGGIAGYANAVPAGTVTGGMGADQALLRIENVFHTGNPEDPEVGGVWAKDSNAGGIIGNARYAHLTYTFDINPGPDQLDVGGTGAANSKGGHSVMSEAFNDPRVMRDPYSIEGVGLHMVANAARVRASSFEPDRIHGNTGAFVYITTGEFLNLSSQNAGGAIGAMTGGRAERLYSLKGEVVTPKNLGGIIGYSADHALIKQVSRMGVYNRKKYESLQKDGQYNIYSYVDPQGSLIMADLDGVDLLAGTETTGADATTVRTRGSLNVGGIVGFADSSSQVLDTRNLVRVEGRAYVGGIVGQAGRNAEITLAHNMQRVTGRINAPEDEAHKDDLLHVNQMDKEYLDRSVVDGCYIGGIVGKTYDTNGSGMNPTVITMAKNDPLLTQNFEERLTEVLDGRNKDVRGGNHENRIDGRRYIGGITGAHGAVNYTVNTGQITGVQHIGGISGQGYRITNSFNTADILAENNYLYLGNHIPVFSQAAFVGGLAGQVGHRSERKIQFAESGSYIKNSFNASARVNGASIIGGITGYAVSPVDTTYNSARITTHQTNRGNSGNEILETGNKTGGIVGQTAQDRAGAIRIIDGYNSGIVGGTGDVGGVLGFVEYYGDGEIVSPPGTKLSRITNSYFIKDSSVRYFDTMTTQVSTDVNATLRALNLDADFPIDQFVDRTATASNIRDETIVDSEYGARNYSNMIFDDYIDFKKPLLEAAGRSIEASGSERMGMSSLQNPLNKGKKLDWQEGGNILQASSSDREQMGAAKFVFPYATSQTGDNPILMGRDYEFLHLDFSGMNIGNEQELPGIQLDPNTLELPKSNQWFTSVDNTAPSIMYNVWSTKVVDYMKVDVAYDDGGSAEDTVYRDYGTGKTPGTAKALLAGQTNAVGMPLWQVNYNYAGTTGMKDNHVPTSVFTPETLTLNGRFVGQLEDGRYKVPRIMKFNIYDGYSRGDYSYDNSDFTVKLVENPIQKSYVLVGEDEWSNVIAASGRAVPAAGKEIKFLQPDGSTETFFFYIETNLTAANGEADPEAEEIMKLIEVSLRTAQDGSGELEWMITLPSVEMDTYLAAKSGFFTAEAVKIYDTSDNIAFDRYTTWERVSRMFNMHFSNYYSSKNETLHGTPDSGQNRGIFDRYPNLDLDDFEDGAITRTYDAGETAALGSVKLNPAETPDADAPEYEEYVEFVTNRLQIANERHLYNLNKNQNQGTSRIDSYLPYINRDIQLIRDVELSTDGDGYNCFIIGMSKGSYNRMTGSLDGKDMAGNVRTIGNLQVDMRKSTQLPIDLEAESYGLIYDLSGGVVKNLQIGSDSRIRARKTGVLAYQASNGKSGTDVLNNPWYENLEPELRIEQGVDAKIYDTRINADVTGAEVGGFVYQTVRRFETSEESNSAEGRKAVDALTITNSQFGGKINTFKGERDENAYLGESLISAGFLCRMKGYFDDNNLLESMANGFYAQKAHINGSEVTTDAYIYGKAYSAGIAGAVDNISVAQTITVQKSANNGTVVSTRRASGISQGIMENGGNSINNSGVIALYSYNNGIVQTPETIGLASGIGNMIRSSEYCTNNGTVIGRIASGISNYGARNIKIRQSVNNGYIRGGQIAGGIVAAPARFNEAEKKALPYRWPGLSLNLSNCYNTGTVVVLTNVDNSRDGNKVDAIYNSYAGGIIGMALLFDEEVDWFKLSDDYFLSKIPAVDDRKTVLRNCYNAGRVYYEYMERFSLNHRYLGGIAGGGMHRFVDIQNCYNLSDAEARAGTMATMYRADLDLENYAFVTPEEWKEVIETKEPLHDFAYNYNLTAVGDMPYGSNVTSMPFADMLNLENFVGFNEDTDYNADGEAEPIWLVDHTAESVNGFLYPFPQFAMKEDQVGELFVGDDYQADQAIPDAVFNVNLNREKFQADVTETARAIRIGNVTEKQLIDAGITYQQQTGIGDLGALDAIDATASNANPTEIITESRYTIGLSGRSSNYEVYVYDGDADATDYAPILVRRYEVSGNTVKSGGKLHDERSVSEQEMQYFNTVSGGPDYAAGNENALTIGDKESVGWYMPIHGYYTVVVVNRGGVDFIATPAQYNSRIRKLSKSSATRGGVTAAQTADSSERFQIHFGGDSIENRSGIYKAGTREKPYKVTDQYSILGMTTSGIAQNATDRRYYQQVSDIVITERVNPMFAFHGVYDGANPDRTPSGVTGEPVMRENFTISYRTDHGGFGFINYLTPTKEALEEGFIPTVSNLNILVEANGDYSTRLGRYYEAANYTTALGLVADYAENARMEGITTLGNVVYQHANVISFRDGYFGDRSAAMGGITGISKNTVIRNAKNNATLGGEVTQSESMADGMQVGFTQHAQPENGVHVAGIAAVALRKGGQGVLESVVNNGELRATAGQDAAGIAHSIQGVSVYYAANGGWIRAMNGTAAGLVHTTDSDIKDGYNSGPVSAGSVKNLASGNAVGLFWNADHSAVSHVYNAGLVRGNRQGAITNGRNITALAGRAYYLKDEDLYWMEASALPDSMEITDEKQVELYLGFGHVPAELYGFTEDEEEEAPYDNGDPFAVSYRELTDPAVMVGKGFDLTNTWNITEPANTPELDGSFLRQYQNDEYPLPQFQEYPHLTRRHLGFPVFLGGSKEVAKVPYEGGDEVVKYIPFDYQAGERDETFKDTIAVDLNDLSTTSRYRVVIYDGNPQMSEDSKGKLRYDTPPRLEITIQRRYIDTRDMTFTTSTGNAGEITPAAIGNPLNKEYGELFSNERGAYFYEVNANDRTGTERAAVFKVKEFLKENRVELLLSNDILDELEEPGTGTASREPYYTVTVVESQVALKEEDTNWTNYYSKFNPHFANATAKQPEAWQYGSSGDHPYEIATQRNLHNIGKGTDATAYLGNAYRQTQDIRLSAKKANAAIANAATNAIGVSQYGTSASPAEAKATVMKRQEDRKELWTTSVGGVTAATRQGFWGTYTAAIGTANTDPDTISGGYKLVDTRTEIKSGIFGRVSPGASISDIGYELNPMRIALSPSGNQEYAVYQATVDASVKALLIEENLGLADNILFAGAADKTVKTLNLTAGADTFALAVGSTSQDRSNPATPKVHRIAVQSGYQIKPAIFGIMPMTLGSVVGRVSGEAELQKLESAATITADITYPYRDAADTIGILVGEIQASGIGNDRVTISEASVTGEIDIRVSANKTIGGMIGSIRGADVQLQNITVGRPDADGNPESRFKLSSTVSAGGSAAVMGGIVGSVHGGRTVLANATSYLSIQSNNANGDRIGGMIGVVAGAKTPEEPETEVFIASGSNAGIVLKNTGKGTSILGGIIGQTEGISRVGLNGVSTGSEDNDRSAIVMETTDYDVSDKIAGGIIGKVDGEQAVVEMTDVTNRLTIHAESTLANPDYYLGGMIGYANRGILYLHDTDSTEETNLLNQGSILIMHQAAGSSRIYAAGGIGYMNDSAATVFALRNEGDITAAFKERHLTGYRESDVYIAGIAAYAEGDLKGVYADDEAGTFEIGEAFSVTESLNTGAIRDERNMKEITGASVAGGMIARLDGKAGSADDDNPVQILYNHNAGVIRGLRAAGILTEISEDMEHAIRKTEDTIESPIDLKWNINISPIDAGYAEEEEHPVITGGDITLVYRLPLAMIDDVEADGYDIGAALATPGDATPIVATPSDAASGEATPDEQVPDEEASDEVSLPDLATPSVAYYNAALEDMVKAPDFESEPNLPGLLLDRVSAARLSLAQLQSIERFREATRWDDPEVLQEEGSVVPSILPKWIMVEGSGPGILENRYIPPGGISRLAKAPELVKAELVPMEIAVRTWRMEQVTVSAEETDEEEREAGSEDIELINDLEGEVVTATPSDAKPSKATPSDAARDSYKMVETVEMVEAGGYEISFSYTGEIPEDARTATGSDAEPYEMPDYEFLVVWEAGGVKIHSTETGVLLPDADGIYHFTMDPEMIAEGTAKLSGRETLDVQFSIAVWNDGRMYRGAAESITLDPVYRDAGAEGSAAFYRDTEYDLAAYPDVTRRLIQYGLSRVGDPYSQPLAGQGNYVDCSYFVMDSYRQFGVRLPRTAAAQAQYLETADMTVSMGQLEPGDLIYYSFEKNGRYRNISHVAMYAGNGMVVDASSSKKEVVYRGMFGLDSVVTCARPVARNGAGTDAP